MCFSDRFFTDVISSSFFAGHFEPKVKRFTFAMQRTHCDLRNKHSDIAYAFGIFESQLLISGLRRQVFFLSLCCLSSENGFHSKVITSYQRLSLVFSISFYFLFISLIVRIIKNSQKTIYKSSDIISQRQSVHANLFVCSCSHNDLDELIMNIACTMRWPKLLATDFTFIVFAR